MHDWSFVGCNSIDEAKVMAHRIQTCHICEPRCIRSSQNLQLQMHCFVGERTDTVTGTGSPYKSTWIPSSG